MKGIAVITTVFCWHFECLGQGRPVHLAIPLKKVNITAQTMVIHTFTEIEDDLKSYRLPERVQRFKHIVKYYETVPWQALNKRYIRGIITKEQLEARANPDFSDSLRMSMCPLRSSIGILIYDSLQFRCFVIDQNVNKNFNDDVIYVFSKRKIAAHAAEYKNKMFFSATTEYYYKENIYSVTNKYIIYPFDTTFRYSSEIENELFCTIGIGQNDYKTSITKDLIINVANEIPIDVFDSRYYSILVSGSGQNGISYKVGDTIKSGSYYYRFDSINLNLRKLYLTQFKNSNSLFGYAEGMIAYNFHYTTFKGFQNSIFAQRGKYILLDFWGTWCKPCIAAFPRIKRLQEAYPEHKFRIVGIASEHDSDTARFSSFLNNHGLSWQIVFQTNVSSERIAERFRITAYPTYILINPSGKIIFRSGNNPELDLERIEEILNPNMQ